MKYRLLLCFYFAVYFGLYADEIVPLALGATIETCMAFKEYEDYARCKDALSGKLPLDEFRQAFYRGEFGVMPAGAAGEVLGIRDSLVYVAFNGVVFTCWVEAKKLLITPLTDDYLEKSRR